MYHISKKKLLNDYNYVNYLKGIKIYNVIKVNVIFNINKYLNKIILIKIW